VAVSNLTTQNLQLLKLILIYKTNNWPGDRTTETGGLVVGKDVEIIVKLEMRQVPQ